MAYRTTKRDGNHGEIVDALRKAGASVLDLAAVGGGAPDLLVGYRGVNYLIEIKDPSQKGAGLQQNQIDWIDAWRGAKPAVAWDVREALAIVGVIVRKGRWSAGIDGGDV